MCYGQFMKNMGGAQSSFSKDIYKHFDLEIDLDCEDQNVFRIIEKVRPKWKLSDGFIQVNDLYHTLNQYTI